MKKDSLPEGLCLPPCWFLSCWQVLKRWAEFVGAMGGLDVPQPLELSFAEEVGVEEEEGDAEAHFQLRVGHAFVSPDLQMMSCDQAKSAGAMVGPCGHQPLG